MGLPLGFVVVITSHFDANYQECLIVV